MKIGNLTLNGVAALAPMAGATDRPFRELCCSFGAAYCVTEMVSTRALQYNYKKTQELITLGEKEHPVAIQMFGDDPLIFASAAKRWDEYGTPDSMHHPGTRRLLSFRPEHQPAGSYHRTRHCHNKTFRRRTRLWAARRLPDTGAPSRGVRIRLQGRLVSVHRRNSRKIRKQQTKRALPRAARANGRAFCFWSFALDYRAPSLLHASMMQSMPSSSR